MRKLILAGVVGVVSTIAGANTPLAIQSGQPAPLNNEVVYADNSYQPARTIKYQDTIEPRASLILEYSAQKGKFANDTDEDLNGFGIGVSSSPHKNGFWGKIEYQENSEYDGEAYEFSFGGHLSLLNVNGFYVLGTAGTGIGVLDVSGFDTSTYFTVPIGLEAGYTFTPAFSLYTGIGYKWSWDISSSTTCKNGTQSNSTGSGTCSWNGGIDHYNYTVGDFDGITYKAGLRYNF